MNLVFNNFQNHSSTAFSHTISSDFTDKRQMSAGVAVLFRRRFGRPCDKECIAKNLTYQRVPDGATVYGLVTKSQYFRKPGIDDYDSAFKTFTEDFKSRNLTTLFCSPMGCVRDLIKPEHFARKIVEFQRCTNAKIRVVSYDQHSHRVLRNGLSHQEFVKTLSREIEKHQELNQIHHQSLSEYPPLRSPTKTILQPTTNTTQNLQSTSSSPPSDTYAETLKSGSPKKPVTPPRVAKQDHPRSESSSSQSPVEDHQKSPKTLISGDTSVFL